MTHKRFKIAILINYAAHSGRAKKNWQNIEGEILRLLPEKPEIISFQPPFEIQKSLKNLIENQSVNCIISAGGDGTVNHILKMWIYRISISAASVWVQVMIL